MRQIDEIVAQLAPQPDRASRLAALPRRPAPAMAAEHGSEASAPRIQMPVNAMSSTIGAKPSMRPEVAASPHAPPAPRALAYGSAMAVAVPTSASPASVAPPSTASSFTTRSRGPKAACTRSPTSSSAAKPTTCCTPNKTTAKPISSSATTLASKKPVSCTARCRLSARPVARSTRVDPRFVHLQRRRGLSAT